MTIPRIHEFAKFYRLLKKGAPSNYNPFFLIVEPGDKNPDTGFGSWKAPKHRLTFEQALQWMKCGWNIGIAATHNDPLVIVDIDDLDKTPLSEIKSTLTVLSRKRAGVHCFYFNLLEDIGNIPTEYGEVRADWQYVVASGSYIRPPKKQSDLEKLLAKVAIEDRCNIGYYTVLDSRPPSPITPEELPEIFKNTLLEVRKKESTAPRRREFNPKQARKHSAVFEITAKDIVYREGGNTNPSDRWASVFHGSDTGKNTSLSNDELMQCWRCNVSHNGLQALTVLSGFLSCREAGSPHANSNAGPSEIINNDGAIFHAWKYAKQNGYIPDNDPIPIRAMKYIAVEHGIMSRSEIEKNGLRAHAFYEVLRIVREDY